jgi:type I restriction enzyme S subunit
MANNGWKQTLLGEFVSLQRGFDLPVECRRPGDIPVIGSAGPNGFHDTARCEGPGVTIGRSGVGSMGVVTFVKEDFWPHNTTLFVTNFHGNDPRFAYYFLNSLNLRRYDSGSAQASLNRNYIHAVPIKVPEPPEQEVIAHILGTLDDKIELNRRMNQTLEAMARALFKSWFIDFDPVRAKADGRRPAGLDAATAALFPDRFEDSPLGKIPKGWRVAAIGDMVEAVGGATPSTEEPTYWSGTIPFATPKDLAKLQEPFLIQTERCITEEGLACISSGLLTAGTVLMSSRAPIGYLAIAERPVAVNQGFVAMKCSDDLPNYYVLHWARENMDEIVAHANGTTFLEISKKNFRPIKALVPAAPALATFVQRVEPMYNRILANMHESKTLAAARDAVLPKLLSGEVRV